MGVIMVIGPRVRSFRLKPPRKYRLRFQGNQRNHHGADEKSPTYLHPNCDGRPNLVPHPTATAPISRRTLINKISRMMLQNSSLRHATRRRLTEKLNCDAPTRNTIRNNRRRCHSQE
ncbi:hypothetical protein Zmor_009678 [Zophobas morio]|uniref:Uncharacterized protein n=1 Tax=Zophobas morio TaxID=2755281 RepID=A0AA38IJE7_9CUCU|nr:hypothetical protein Zmor_009678 [Zophobas morio]